MVSKEILDDALDILNEDEFDELRLLSKPVTEYLGKH
jgi:hypothetical protein